MARTDLTGYAALLGESLSSRVGLLEKLLRNAHYPSLGQYKERLLADTIRGFLPRTVEVGTGFVMFPHEDPNPPGGPDLYDPLNQSAYSVSRQCDILIYDVARFPPVFRDGEFVVVRPEAVRAVIEVKGSLSIKETQTLLESFHDFAGKWRKTQLFYLKHHQPTAPAPGLFAMAWQIQRRANGQPTTTPTRVRETVADFYATHVQESEADGYPFLSKVLIHNEAEIGSVFGLDKVDGKFLHRFGWHSADGRFARVGPDGKLFRDKDRTVASLLASLHWEVGREHFNRFFSYTDEVKDRRSLHYEHEGISWAWSNLPEGKRFNADVPETQT